jgi:hypothetical protein
METHRTQHPVSTPVTSSTDVQEHTMYGPGTAPPQPRPANRGLVIGLRVLFVVLPVVTLGVGAWGSVLRLAVVLRRPLDWLLMPVVAAAGVGGFVLVGVSQDENDWQSNTGAACLLACMVLTPVYFLIVDILGARRARLSPRAGAPMRPNPYAPRHTPGPAPRPMPGTVPGPIPGAAPGPVPGAPGIPAGPPYGYGQQHRPAAPAQPPGPRIHQVRAELDELSDFLRKEEGR